MLNFLHLVAILVCLLCGVGEVVFIGFMRALICRKTLSAAALNKAAESTETNLAVNVS